MGRTTPKKFRLPVGVLTLSNVVSWAHPNQSPKQHLDQFSHFCMNMTNTHTHTQTDHTTLSVSVLMAQSM